MIFFQVEKFQLFKFHKLITLSKHNIILYILVNHVVKNKFVITHYYKTF